MKPGSARSEQLDQAKHFTPKHVALRTDPLRGVRHPGRPTFEPPRGQAASAETSATSTAIGALASSAAQASNRRRRGPR